SMVFLEALRQFQFVVGRENVVFVHVSLVPAVGGEAEQKSKPTQHSVKELRSLGLSPDIIVCRSGSELSASARQKISTFCHVPPSQIVSVFDVSNIYHVPLILERQNVHRIVQRLLDLPVLSPNLAAWQAMAERVDHLAEKVDIAVVGKYIEQQDSYLSLLKALKHSAIALNTDVVVNWVEASDLEDACKSAQPEKHSQAWAVLRRVKGILVPGGFGARGIEGKVLAAQFAREHKVPYLGICLGMQIMVIEFARHVLGLAQANSTEFDPQTPHPVVIFMPEISQAEMGGTMRLGSRSTKVQTCSLAAQIYGESDIDQSDLSSSFEIYERHRHRYEINPEYVSSLSNQGIRFSGTGDDGGRMVTAELNEQDHPFFFGTQFHPEFKSRPNRPSPPFFAFAAAALGKRDKLGEAGVMWRNHEEAIKSEIALLYSPTSFKRKEVPVSNATLTVATNADLNGFSDSTYIGDGSSTVLTTPISKTRRLV
ncbi:CTP synthase (glutamine hydrolyzing), partial [archaeon]